MIFPIFWLLRFLEGIKQIQVIWCPTFCNITRNWNDKECE